MGLPVPAQTELFGLYDGLRADENASIDHAHARTYVHTHPLCFATCWWCLAGRTGTAAWRDVARVMGRRLKSTAAVASGGAAEAAAGPVGTMQ